MDSRLVFMFCFNEKRNVNTHKYRKGSRSKQSVVVKVTNKKLHSQSIVVLNGQKHKVLENIVSESTIQKYLTSKPDCPNSIVKFHDLSERYVHI